MAWILLLIQLLPSVLKLIQLIRELIAVQPTKAEKKVAWDKLKRIARQNVRKKRGQAAYVVRTSEATVLDELQALADDLKAKAVPA